MTICRPKFLSRFLMVISIKTSFEKTVPRLSQGGIIVVHDYRNAALPGSAKAVNEFVDAHKDEYEFRLAASLAILVKK